MRIEIRFNNQHIKYLGPYQVTELAQAHRDQAKTVLPQTMMLDMLRHVVKDLIFLSIKRTCKLVDTVKHVEEHIERLCHRKGFYPYERVDGIEKARL